MLVTLLSWYVFCGIMFGFFVTYMTLKKFRTWGALCADFNTKVAQDDIPVLTPKVAMVLVPIICISVFSIIWMPFLIYIGSNKQ